MQVQSPKIITNNLVMPSADTCTHNLKISRQGSPSNDLRLNLFMESFDAIETLLTRATNSTLEAYNRYFISSEEFEKMIEDDE